MTTLFSRARTAVPYVAHPMRNAIRSLLLCSGLALAGATASAQGLQGVIVEEYTTISAADAAFYNGLGNGSYTLAAGDKCYRIYIDMAPNYNLNSVFGSAANVLDISSTAPFFNDDNWGSQFPGETRRLDEGLAFDSWITIGRASKASSGAAGCTGVLEQLGVLRAADTNGNLTMCNNYTGFGPTDTDGHVPGASLDVSTVGIALGDLNAFTADGSAFTTTGSWALLPAQAGPEATGNNRVLIAQVTTSGTLSFHLNVSLAAPGGGLEFYTHASAESGSVVSPYLTYPVACTPVQITSATSNSPICSNQTLNLNVVAAGTAPISYTWTGVGTISNGDQPSASVTGAATGNYNIAVSNACGNVNQNVAVVVNTAVTYYADVDGDGFGDPGGATQQACSQPVGFVSNNTDNCPNDPLKQAPGACGCGVADVATTYYADTDGDGFGDPAAPQAGFTCNVPSGFVSDNTDNCPSLFGRIGDSCDDGNAGTTGDVITPACVCAGSPITTITGCSSSQSPYVKPIGIGNTTTSLLTVGDQIGGYKMVGIPDGMGAFDNNDGTFTLLMNHELGNTVGVTRTHGSIGAFVSKWIINKSSLCVQSGSDLIQNVQIWNGSNFVAGTPGSTATTFNRFCSADLPAVSAFYNAGTGKGTQNRIFMNGEESGAEGRAFAHIVNGPAAGTTYQLPRLGRFSWENSVACPVAQDKTIVVGTDDSTPGQVYIYIGTKQSSGSDIEKAGLHNGNLYGIVVSGLATETNASFPATATPFTLANLGDVSNLTGAQINTSSNTSGITNFLRPEDAAWDPRNPNVLYFVTTNAFTSPSRLYQVTFTDILQPELGGTIVAVLNGTEGQKMFDNITVDQQGRVLLQEDPGNQAYVARMYSYDIATDVLTPIAYNDSSRFLIGGANYLTQDEENSGIIDMQDILGVGKYLFNTQAHYGIAGELVEGGQLELFTTTSTAAPCQPVTINGISGAQTVCNLDPLTLNVVATGSLPITYSWSGPGGFSSSDPSVLVNSAATGNYSVTVTNACGNATGNVNVTVPSVDDGDPCTTDACAGGVVSHTPIVCDDSDACTSDACVGGVCQYTPISCDDSDPCTTDACVAGVCQNTPIVCDDSDACTTDACVGGVCQYTPISCDDSDPCTTDACVAGVCQNTPIVCDDSDACTTDACAGGVCQYTPIVCDDSDACTTDACVGGVCQYTPIVCNDGNACTTDACVGGVCQYTPIVCDDSNPCTIDACVGGVCQYTNVADGTSCGVSSVCIGGVCTVVTCADNNINLELATDGNGAQTSWQIVNIGTSTVVCSGPTTPYGNNTTYNEYCCLADGCYELKVFDTFGDGMTTGGYRLKDQFGKRIIDNWNDGAFGTLSTIASNTGFCLDLGTDQLTSGSCDQETLSTTSVLVAMENTSVTAQYGITNATSGYQFQIFNPDGGYLRNIFQNMTTGAGTGAQKSRSLALNFTTNPVPALQLLNIRVRGRINNVNNAYGPVCRMKVGQPTNCPTTQLVNIAGPLLSCGVTGKMVGGPGNSGRIYANTVSGATHYKFRFQSGTYLRIIASTSSTLTLGAWATNPLLCGTNTYNVDVAVSLNHAASYCPFGPVCTVGITGGTPCTSGGTLQALDASDVNGELSMWPNPNRGDQLYLTMTGIDADITTVSVDVHDLFGKRVIGETVVTGGGDLNHVMELGSIASGVYTVTVTAGDVIKTQRLVIQ